MKFNLSLGRGRSGGGSKFDIKQFMLQHAEKVVLGAACLFMLLLVWRGSRSGSEFDTSRDPNALIQDISRVQDAIDQPRWDNVYKPLRDRTDRRDLRVRAKEALNVVTIDDYPTPMPWKPLIFPPQKKRTDPVLLPVRELIANAGYGALAIQDESEGRRWDESGESALQERPSRPLPVADQIELNQGEDAITAQSVQGHHFVCLTGLIPFQEQLDRYNECFQDAAGYDRVRDYPYYYTFSVQRVEVKNENDQVDWTDASLTLPWAQIFQTTFRESWSQHPQEIADSRHVLQSEAFISSGFEIPPLVGRDLKKWALHPRIPEATLDTYGERAASETQEQTQPAETNPWRNRDVGGFGGEGADGETGGDWRNRGTNEGVNNTGEGTYAGDRDPVTEFKLFRFFDFNVEPGKSYRYRVAVWLEDPNYPTEERPAISLRMLSTDAADRIRPKMQDTDPARAKMNHYRMSDWSDPTGVVTVSLGRQFLAGSVSPAQTMRSSDAPRPYTEPTAKVVAMQWDNARAANIPVETEVQRGSVGNFTTETEFLRPTDNSLEKLTYDFQLDTVVVDIAGGEPIHSGGRGNGLTAPGELLLLDPFGNLIVHNELDDLEAYRQNTFRAPQTSSESYEGGGVDLGNEPNPTPERERL